MGRLQPILFTAIVALVAAGMDFYLAHKAHAGAPYGLSDHLAARSGGLFEPAPEAADEPAAPTPVQRETAGQRETVVPLSSAGCSSRSGSKFCGVASN